MATISCQTAKPDLISFYLEAGNKKYLLCNYRYYTSVWNYFVGGSPISSVFSKAGKHSHALRAIKRKLPAYLQYVEKEEGIAVLQKTQQKRDKRAFSSKKQAYKRQRFDWRKAVAEEFDF